MESGRQVLYDCYHAQLNKCAVLMHRRHGQKVMRSALPVCSTACDDQMLDTNDHEVPTVTLSRMYYARIRVMQTPCRKPKFLWSKPQRICCKSRLP
jgi:hypothetical protein